MTGLRPTRRRLLGAVGAAAAGAGALYAAPPRRVSASLHTYRYHLSVRERTASGDATVADLPAGARRPIEEAIDGGYETDDPPEALLAFFDRHGLADPPVVEDDGAYYRLSATLPMQVLRLEPVPASEAEGAPTLDEFSRCLSEEEGLRERPPLEARDGAVRRYYLDDRFRNCVERHPYLEWDGEFYRWNVSVDDPGPPYRVDADPVAASELLDLEGSIGRWEALSSGVRSVLEEARFDDGSASQGDDPWGEAVVTDSLPDGVVAAAEKHDYLRRGDAFLEPTLTDAASWGLSVSLEVPDAQTREFDPAWLELTLAHDGERPVEVVTQPPTPFGPLWAARAGTAGCCDLVLWSPDAGESDHEYAFAGRARDHSLAAVQRFLTVTPGDRTTARYALRRNPGRLATGDYLVTEGLRLARPDEDGREKTLPVELELTVERPD